MKSRKYGISEWLALREALKLSPVQSFANIRVITILTAGPKGSAQLVPISALNSVMSQCLLSHNLFPFMFSSHLLLSHPNSRFPAEHCIFSLLSLYIKKMNVAVWDHRAVCMCVFCPPPINLEFRKQSLWNLAWLSRNLNPSQRPTS
jgi:hypothetical protein